MADPETTPPPSRPDFIPPGGPAHHGGDNGQRRMLELAGLIEQIMRAHAGGYNSPVQVETADEGAVATTPAQIMEDLCQSNYDLLEEVKALRRQIRRMSDAMETDEPEPARGRKHR